MLRCTVASFVFLALILPSPAYGQEPGAEFVPTYSLGDQIISLNLGMFIPLFFAGGDDGIQYTNLSVGGTGHLMWSGFLSSNFAIGGEFGGMFSFSPNGNPLYMIPLAARGTYFIRRYPFEFPISLATGVTFTSYNESFKIDPIIIPGAGVHWSLNPEWSFGFDVRYWLVPQIYLSGREIPTSDNRLGNFLSTTASVLYRF